MDIQHIQTLLILAERARQAGLIQFNEFPPVLQAIEAGNKAVQAAQQQAQPPEEGEVQKTPKK
jgi:hypothetical protein